jgi:uncharacterized damage-inducible protein DinB
VSLDSTSSVVTIAHDELLQHWQGHRRVTRRVISAFPDRELFTYSIGGMRPCAALAMELIGMTSAGIRGVATRHWETEIYAGAPSPKTKDELLRRWDDVTSQMDTLWPQIPAHRFEEVDTAFGQYEGRVFGLLLYWIDNEIHHRGQAYVYLRSLGIEPPAFYDRS